MKEIIAGLWIGTKEECNKDKILNILDEKFIRMWEFYLLTSEYSFRNMGNVVFQLVISKKQEAWPLTRNFIYN